MSREVDSVTCKEAARKVLEDAGVPLHYKEITKRALEQGLWQTHGKTPEATLNAQLAVDIKRKKAGSAFVRTTPGIFALRTWDVPQYVLASRTSTNEVPDDEKTYSFTAAAERILREAKDKQPLHYRNITEEALSRGLISTSGQTPWASMYAQILQEIKRARARGEQPRFVKHGRGYIGLTEWMGKGLAFEIEQHNRRVRGELRKHLHTVAPDEFEQLVSELLAAIGFENVEVTSRSKDGGIDVRGVLVTGDVVRTRMAVQVKRWKQNIPAPAVQQVRGSLGSHEQGLIITTSDLSRGAKNEAERYDATPVALMNGEQLVALMAEQEIGVVRSSHEILELGELGDASE